MGTALTSLKKIKPKYIGIWLKDQLSQPDWFRNLIVNRSAWGAFSVYAHARRSDGKAKISYKSKAKAEKAAFDMSKKYGYPFTTYKCLFCDGWHVSKAVGKNARCKITEEMLIDKNTINAMHNWEGLDVERIMSTRIPDLAQVYGGFRGRTLSSLHQRFHFNRFRNVWKIIRESGIRQVIDLRAVYSSDFYSELCRRRHIGYFKYPIAYEEKWIAKMVELFPEFCRLIDEGQFYISCDMGLHRTDMALSIYWMFHGADNGMNPPILRGHIVDGELVLDRLNNKVFRRLNSLYAYLMDNNVIHIPNREIFAQRKKDLIDFNRRHISMV